MCLPYLILQTLDFLSIPCCTLLAFHLSRFSSCLRALLYLTFANFYEVRSQNSVVYGYITLSYVLAELGDYEEGVHSPGVVSEFRFVESQTEEMELAILEKFKLCK